MIEPMEADIGREVIYSPDPCAMGAGKPIKGTIVSFDALFVYVRQYPRQDLSRAFGIRRVDLYWREENDQPNGTA